MFDQHSSSQMACQPGRGENFMADGQLSLLPEVVTLFGMPHCRGCGQVADR